METTNQIRTIYCPLCKRRLLDRLSQTEGEIEMKCPRCRQVVRIDLSKRVGHIYFKRKAPEIYRSYYA